jgi:hypothetical protein
MKSGVARPFLVLAMLMFAANGPALAQRAGGKALRTACRPDIQQYCAGVEREGLRACLRQNAAKFTQPCREALVSAAAAARQPQATPSPDVSPAPKTPQE